MTKTYTESELNAALVAMVEKCAEAVRCGLNGHDHGECDCGHIKEDIRALLPAETVAQVERERKRLQLEARIDEAKIFHRQMYAHALDECYKFREDCQGCPCERIAALEDELKAAVEGK